MNMTPHLYRAAHNYPPGMVELAKALDAPDEPVSDSSLQKKVNPRYPGAHCSPEQALRIMELTGDHGMLFAQCQRLGYVAMALPQLADGVNAPAVESMTATIREFSEFMAELSADLVDNKVNDNELARIQKEGREAIAALQQLIALAEQINERARPASMRGSVGLKAA